MASHLKRPYSMGEEIANAVTHGVGIVVSIAALVILDVFAVMRGTVWHVVAYSIFGASMIILYSASTVYHAVRNPSAKKVLDIFDHSSIFILIAGTYTAVCLTALRPTVGWWMFGVQWAIALFGILSKALFMEKVRGLSAGLYALMGWLIVFVWKDFTAAVPSTAIALLAAGGFAYTAGILFYSLQKVKWFHSIWHLFVVGGTVCHFLCMIAMLY